MQYIKNLERNQYWKQDQFGYTRDLNEAGLFDSDEALKICRNANINGSVTEISMTAEDIVYGDELEQHTAKPFTKKSIDDVMEIITHETYHETNPINYVFNTLIKNHYYPDEDNDNLYNFGHPINYGETFNQNIKIDGERNLFIKMSIYRNESGQYELTSYKNGADQKKERKSRNRLNP